MVIIGGITGGIGRELAQLLLKEGVCVGGFARGKSRIESLTAEMPDLRLCCADATSPDQLEQARDNLLAGDDLHAYVHCIGSIHIKPAHLTSDLEWFETLNQNLNSAFFALRTFIMPMIRRRNGCMLLLSSAAASTGVSSHEAIAAAKGGIEGLTISAAATYANYGIRVNAVAPGLVETPLSADLIASETARRISDRMHPIGRIGTPTDVAAALHWLLSASWVTGQVLPVDGGLTRLKSKATA